MPIRQLSAACLVLITSACQQAATAPAPDPAPDTSQAAASASDAAASPRAEVEASMARFAAARSFHASMDMQGGQSMTMEMDYVAPDRYRMQMPEAVQVVVGDIMYMQLHGQTMQIPLSPDTLGKWQDPLQMEQGRERMNVADLGSERVEGQPARKFQVRHAAPEEAEMTYWIGDDGLPLKLLHHGRSEAGPFTMTIRYSRFNDPSLSIERP